MGTARVLLAEADESKWAVWTRHLLRGDRPLRVNAGFATHEVLEVLGVSPFRGRIFSEDEDQPGGDAVFVMAYETWQGRFAGDEDLLGSTLVVNGTPSTLVGIMPPKFEVKSTSASSSSIPNDTCDDFRPLMEPGFQCRAPIASRGAAVPAPPIDRFTVPTP